jgi:hypothetical protein
VQLVGVACCVCNEGIRFAPDAGGCPACKLAFHKACCQSPGCCPKCGCDFASLNDAAVQASRVTLDAHVARGRQIVIWSSVALLALQLCAVLAMLVTDSDAVVKESLRFLGMVAVVLAVYLRFAAARVYLLIALALNVVLSVAMLLGGIEDSNPLVLAVAIVVLAVYGTSLVLLSGKSAGLYFAREREVT